MLTGLSQTLRVQLLTYKVMIADSVGIGQSKMIRDGLALEVSPGLRSCDLGPLVVETTVQRTLRWVPVVRTGAKALTVGGPLVSCVVQVEWQQVVGVLG